MAGGTPDFEDMAAHDWPKELQMLQRATTAALDAYAELDDLIDHTLAGERGPILELAGWAWKLYRDLQALGVGKVSALQGDA